MTKMILVATPANDITGDLMCNVNTHTYNCITTKEDKESNSPSGEACACAGNSHVIQPPPPPPIYSAC